MLRDQLEYEPSAGHAGRPCCACSPTAIGSWRRDLGRHARAAAAGTRGLTVAVTGASGHRSARPCARSLPAAATRCAGWCDRGPARAAAESDIRWDPDAGTIDQQALAGVDAVVHLAGENIGAGRWTAERKRRIRDSRVEGHQPAGPAPWPDWRRRRACWSAARRSGTTAGAGRGPWTRPPRRATTSWPRWRTPGRRPPRRRPTGASGWPSRASPTCWTHAAARWPGCCPSTGRGLGGQLGGGEQPFPWVALDDVVGAIHHALFDQTLAGPFNVVAPEAVTNAKFNEVLARTLGRPAVLPVPGFALKLALGELAAVAAGRAAGAAGPAGAGRLRVRAIPGWRRPGGDAGARCPADHRRPERRRAEHRTGALTGPARARYGPCRPCHCSGSPCRIPRRLRLDAGAPELRLEELALERELEPGRPVRLLDRSAGVVACGIADPENGVVRIFGRTRGPGLRRRRSSGGGSQPAWRLRRAVGLPGPGRRGVPAGQRRGGRPARPDRPTSTASFLVVSVPGKGLLPVGRLLAEAALASAGDGRRRCRCGGRW